MTQRVVVDKEQCRLIAERLVPLKLRKGYLQRLLPNFSSDDETKLCAFIFSTAICHQTHTLINRKKNLKGWDYIKYVYTKLGKQGSTFLDPKSLATYSAEELAGKLKPLFSEDRNPEHCTLDRVQQRAQFLIDISKQLNKKYAGKVENLIVKSDGLLFNHGIGLYELLEDFPAFADPLRKKSTLFIKFISEANLITIKDPENFVPIMDYHIQRVLLRTGCVKVLDEKLKQALSQRKALRSDEEVRNTAVCAIRKISQLSNKKMFVIHDFFWPLGRSCCKEKTLCADKVCNKRPCTFYLAVDQNKHDRCVFAGVCKGSTDKNYRRFWQPIVDTHYY